MNLIDVGSKSVNVGFVLVLCEVWGAGQAVNFEEEDSK